MQQMWRKIRVETITAIILMVILGYCSLQDMKTGTVNGLLILAGGILLGVLRLTGIPEERVFMVWILKLFPGCLLMFLAFLKEEKVGYGDGLCMLTAGIALWPEDFLKGLLSTLIPIGIYSLWKGMTGTWKKDLKIPYVPFLSAGMLMGILLP